MILSNIAGVPNPHLRTVLGITGENTEVTVVTTDAVTAGVPLMDYSIYSKIAIGGAAMFSILYADLFIVDPSDGTVTYTGSSRRADPFNIDGRFIVEILRGSREMALSAFISKDDGNTWALAAVPTMFEHPRNNRDSTQSIGFSTYLDNGDKVRFAIIQNDGDSLSNVIFKAGSIVVH